MPVRLVELLEQRGVGFVEVPDDEFESMACNVLALAPRVALALDGNPETRTGGSKPRASTCASTPVRSCRARATAAQPA